MINFSTSSWSDFVWIGIAAFVVSTGMKALYAAFAPPLLSRLDRIREQPARSHGKPSRMSSVLTFLAEFASLLVLARLIPSLGINSFAGGLAIGLLIWLGLVTIIMVVNYGFRGAQPRLTFIHAGDWLSVFVVQGTMIGALSS